MIDQNIGENDKRRRLLGEVEALSRNVGLFLKTLKEQDKALSDISKGLRSADLAGLMKAHAKLSPAMLENLGLKERVEELKEMLAAEMRELKSEQRRRFAGELKSALDQAGFGSRMLSDNPPTFRAGRFTLELNLDKMEAVISFSRELLQRVPLRPDRITKALKDESRNLEASSIPPDRFFDALLDAYKALLASRSGKIGDRVDLADLLPRVALELQPDRFKELPVRERFMSYGRVRFVHDLNMLREAGLLARNGYRLDLGTATGDSTKKKSRVFFLEHASGDGQYYLSARFVPSQPTLV